VGQACVILIISSGGLIEIGGSLSANGCDHGSAPFHSETYDQTSYEMLNEGSHPGDSHVSAFFGGKISVDGSVTIIGGGSYQITAHVVVVVVVVDYFASGSGPQVSPNHALDGGWAYLHAESSAIIRVFGRVDLVGGTGGSSSISEGGTSL